MSGRAFWAWEPALTPKRRSKVAWRRASISKWKGAREVSVVSQRGSQEVALAHGLRVFSAIVGSFDFIRWGLPVSIT